jgi:2'-5' RNA ligase
MWVTSALGGTGCAGARPRWAARPRCTARPRCPASARSACRDAGIHRRPPTLAEVRLFVAVRPPSVAIAELETLVTRLRATWPNLTWTLPVQWHLTLVFLGEVPAERLPELERRLGQAARRHAPARVAFAGAGRFGDRVLFTKVGGDVVALRGLARSVQAAARRTGLDVEDRPYRAHLTLARARSGADVRPLVPEANAFRGVEWAAGEIELVRSRLGQGPDRRAAHETLRAWPLTASTRTA